MAEIKLPSDPAELPAVAVRDPDGVYLPQSVIYPDGEFVRLVTEDMVIDIPWDRVIEVRHE